LIKIFRYILFFEGIVDAYDAMISNRPYRKAMRKEEAVGEIMKNAGSQFDPGLVEVFLGVL